MGRPRGHYPRHVRRRDRQIAKGLRGKSTWRRYTISVEQGSRLDLRLQDMKKGTVSDYVRHILNTVDPDEYTKRLKVGDVRMIEEYRCVWTDEGWVPE